MGRAAGASENRVRRRHGRALPQEDPNHVAGCGGREVMAVVGVKPTTVVAVVFIQSGTFT